MMQAAPNLLRVRKDTQNAGRYSDTMTKRFFFILAALLFSLRAAFAQDVIYIQVEAQPSLARAEDRARFYSADLADVNGFSLGAGWYGVALGPYAPSEAQAMLQRLRAEGRIPRDSYLAQPNEFLSQFWPVGAQLNPRALQPVDPIQPEVQVQQPVDEPAQEPVIIEAEPEPLPVVDDETPREARASEARMTRDEKKDLQVALKWAGFYTAAIDGAYGRGTRRSMSLWQEENGFEPTGVMTTYQRALLLQQYNAVLEGMGLRTVNDTRAGITMKLPTGVVKFDRYESPFAHYDASGDLGVKVLLISQPGSATTLFGLYDIMQTLEIVPLDGPREKGRNSFTLVGENSKIVSYTQASVSDGAIKGFTLIWPAGDEERRTRVLDEMIKSFETTSAVLDPAFAGDAPQSVDLISGLEVRKPRFSRSGFYIDRSGTVVTTLEAVQGCERVTLETDYKATVVAQDAELGIAVLRPSEAIAPQSFAQFSPVDPRLKSDVAVAGYSYEGAIGSPLLTFGTLADLRGLRGEDNVKRLAMAVLPGDAGGPVFDMAGSVVGMLLPRGSGNRQLPEDVNFAAKASAIQDLLSQAGVPVQSSAAAASMAPEDLSKLAGRMTALVSCWD